MSLTNQSVMKSSGIHSLSVESWFPARPQRSFRDHLVVVIFWGLLTSLQYSKSTWNLTFCVQRPPPKKWYFKHRVATSVSKYDMVIHANSQNCFSFTVNLLSIRSVDYEDVIFDTLTTTKWKQSIALSFSWYLQTSVVLLGWVVLYSIFQIMN